MAIIDSRATREYGTRSEPGGPGRDVTTSRKDAEERTAWYQEMVPGAEVVSRDVGPWLSDAERRQGATGDVTDVARCAEFLRRELLRTAEEVAGLLPEGMAERITAQVQVGYAAPVAPEYVTVEVVEQTPRK